jgi:hypothetical protein
MKEDSTLSVRGRLLSTAFCSFVFPQAEKVEQSKNLASAFKVVDQLIYVCDAGHSTRADPYGLLSLQASDQGQSKKGL